MKKTLILLLIGIALPTVSFAQVTINCTPVTSFTFNACCTTYRAQNAQSCDVYDKGYSTIPNTVGAGPSTNAINTTTSQDSSAIGTSPRSGSDELKQCSNIRFLSLLDILIWVKCIIVVAIIPIIFALALLFFLWGVMKFIGADDAAKRQEGKKFIISGLIGLFVMTSLWGIIKILGTTLGIESTVPLLQTTYLKK